MEILDVKRLRADLKLTQLQFAREMGVQQPFLSRIENGLDPLPSYFIDIIKEKFNVPDLGSYYTTKASATMRKLKSDINIDHQVVPIFEIEATAGIASVFTGEKRAVPVDHLMIPNLPKADGAMFARGDSMYPLVKNGDLIVYKTISMIPEMLIWGEMYILYFNVEGEEMLTVKFVKQGQTADYICLVSANSHHADKEFHIKYLKSAALVKAVINYRSMM